MKFHNVKTSGDLLINFITIIITIISFNVRELINKVEVAASEVGIDPNNIFVWFKKYKVSNI